MNQQDSVWWLLLLLVGSILAVLLSIHLVLWWIGFQQEKKRIEIEIHRASSSEKRYWLSKKRRLWLSVFPFVRYK